MPRKEAGVKIGVLGCGHMASAVVEAIHAADETVSFVTYTPSQVRAVALAERVKGRAALALDEVGPTDMIVIGCKPHQFASLAKEWVALGIPSQSVVSLMAAVSTEDIQSALETQRVVRLMPSLPMRHGEGIGLLYYSSAVEKETQRFLRRTLEPSSRVVELASEDLLDRLTVVTASGPAYIYFLARVFEGILSESLGKQTLPRELAVQLFKGASVSMEREHQRSLQELVQQVTSEKGVTGEAIESFDRDGLDDILWKGIKKAKARLEEIKRNIQ